MVHVRTQRGSLLSVLMFLTAFAGCGSDGSAQAVPLGGAGQAGADGGAGNAGNAGSGAGGAADGGTGGTGGAADGGTGGTGGDASDAGPDSGPRPLEFAFSEMVIHSKVETFSNQWTDLGLELDLSTTGGEYFFMLNVPGVLTTGGSGAAFRLLVDGQPLASTGFQSVNEQRLSVCVVGLKDVPAGTSKISVQWFADALNQSVRLLPMRVTLLAMRADGAISAVTPTTGDARVYSGAISSPIEFEGWNENKYFEAGDYLFVMSVSDTWTDVSNKPRFRVLLNEKVVAGGIVQPAYNEQRLPITVFGATTIDNAGAQPLTATIENTNNTSSVKVGTGGPSWMMAIPLKNGLIHHQRDMTSEAMIQNGSGTNFISPISVNKNGGMHLFILNAADTWGAANGLVNYSLVKDGTTVGNGTYSAAITNEHMPMTVVYLDINETDYTVEAAWNTQHYAVQGQTFPTQFIATR